jgi:hypothetical protein
MPASSRAGFLDSLDVVSPEKLPAAVLLDCLLADLGLKEHPTVISAAQINKAMVIENRDFMGALFSSGHGDQI